jgi:hypothetical protein
VHIDNWIFIFIFCLSVCNYIEKERNVLFYSRWLGMCYMSVF